MSHKSHCKTLILSGSGNTKGGSITVLLTSCLTSLDQSVLQIKTKIVSCHAADLKLVKQEVNSTVIHPPLVFPVWMIISMANKFQNFIAQVYNMFSSINQILFKSCHALPLFCSGKYLNLIKHLELLKWSYHRNLIYIECLYKLVHILAAKTVAL